MVRDIVAGVLCQENIVPLQSPKGFNHKSNENYSSRGDRVDGPLRIDGGKQKYLEFL